MGKYDQWDAFFASLDGDQVEFDLDDFEELSGVRLPPSAREHPAWWWKGHYYAKWSAYGWVARPLLGTNRIAFEKTGTHQPYSPPDHSTNPRTSDADLILLGCVATKGPVAAPAKDLYVSALWRKRRAYGEATGKPWMILSAEYGLLDPDEVIGPYDRYLEKEPRSYREQWSRIVADGVIRRAREIRARSVEIHAGAAYVDHGLERELVRGGLNVLRPLKGLRQGEQLAWYGGSRLERASPARPPVKAVAETPRSITAEHVTGIAEVYRSGVLGESWEQLPEAWQLPDTEPRSQRLWLTFVAAVDRARDAAFLWNAAHLTWSQTPWVFDPAEVMRRPLTDLVEVLRSAGVTQRHGPDTFAWTVIAESLVSATCPDAIRSAINGKSVEASDLLIAVRSELPNGTPMFPLLRGPKIANMWVRMLAFPGGAPIEGMESIPVAVDTHVQRVTEMLGLVPVHELSDSHRMQIERVWFEGVRRSGRFGAPASIDGTAAGIDPALWALGKEACSRCERDQRRTRVGAICDICILGRLDESHG